MLPVATIVIVAVAFAIRMVRAGVVEAISSDYVQMARMNGIRERRVIVEATRCATRSRRACRCSR